MEVGELQPLPGEVVERQRHDLAAERADQRQSLDAWLAGLETRICDTVAEPGGSISKREGESFCRLLGGYVEYRKPP